MTAQVAALYIDPLGPYPKIEGVDCWDETRDARQYAGPLPVVAHPPCGPWGRLRGFSKNRDKDCALFAVKQVQQWGGVLEHPACSTIWDVCELPKPGKPPDRFGGFSIEVCQVDWGHVAEKRTWLYCVGVKGTFHRPERREPTHVISTLNGARKGKYKACSKQQRRRTPPEFALWLVSLARSVNT